MMTEDEKKDINREHLLYTILCAIVKKNEGEISITEEDMDDVKEYDIMSLHHNKEEGKLIITLQNPMYMLNPILTDEVF